MLDLRLAGQDVDGVSLSFNRAPARNPTNEAEADKTRTETAILKAESGIISPDSAAQELGYDSAFDASLLTDNPEAAKSLHALVMKRRESSQSSTIKLRFDKASQSYRVLLEVIELTA